MERCYLSFRSVASRDDDAEAITSAKLEQCYEMVTLDEVSVPFAHTSVAHLFLYTSAECSCSGERLGGLFLQDTLGSEGSKQRWISTSTYMISLVYLADQCVRRLGQEHPG